MPEGAFPSGLNMLGWLQHCMSEWWRRLSSMPDRERAKVLAKISVGVILGTLYALGAMSLCLRSRYLTVGPGGITPSPLPTLRVIALPAPTRRPTATLYPTITPRRKRTEVLRPTLRQFVRKREPTATPFPSPTMEPTATPTATAPTLTQLPPTKTLAPLRPPPTPTGR